MISRWMLDTNIPIMMMRRPSAQLVARFAVLEPSYACISAVVYGELFHGVAKSNDPANTLAAVESLLVDIPVLPLPVAAAGYYGHLQAFLERRGEMIGSNDLWIASHALAEDLTLVSCNENEFRRIPGLKFENWTK